MKRPTKGPLLETVPGLRQRARADGSWRIWWEPNAAALAAGFQVADLSALKPGDAAREARRLNAEAAGHRTGAPAPRPRGAVTLAEVADDYLASMGFRGLSPKSQREYRKNLARITAKWGAELAASFTKPVMRSWYEALHAAHGPRMAQLMIATASILFSHAEMRGWRAENTNPCARLKMATPDPRDRVASWAEVEALLTAAADAGLPSMAAAMSLSLFQGQRETDVFSARRADFYQAPIGGAQVWVWSLIRSKRKTAGMIPLHDQVVPIVAAILARPAPDDAFLLVEERVGRPYDEHLFSKRFTEVRARAAETCPSLTAPGQALQFRDLRRTFGALARRAGALREDVGAILGNTSARDPRLERTYMPPDFATSGRAIGAITRPEPDHERKKLA